MPENTVVEIFSCISTDTHCTQHCNLQISEELRISLKTSGISVASKPFFRPFPVMPGNEHWADLLEHTTHPCNDAVYT